MNLSMAEMHSVATTFNNGRLGNQLSSFASLFAIWSEFEIPFVLGDEQWKSISRVFSVPTHDDHPGSNIWPYYVINRKGKIPNYINPHG